MKFFFSSFFLLILITSCNNISEEIKPQTGNISDVDENKYLTIKIGNQWWMQENLKVTRYNNGDSIPIVRSDSVWAHAKEGMFSYYDNDSALYRTVNGALYNWYAIDNSRGLCPTGWHVPSVDEYDTLVSFLGGNKVAGGKMKINRPASNDNIGATNTSYFSALLVGYRENNGDFVGSGSLGEAYFWTSSKFDEDSAYLMSIYAQNIYIIKRHNINTYGNSVRCIED